MIQNIYEDINNQEINFNEKSENKIISILKEIFQPLNCIIYLLTFLVSTVEIKNEILPFGLAILAACIGGTVPIFAVYIVSFIATAIFHGSAGLATYFYTSIIFFLLTFFFKPKISIEGRNEIFMVGTRIFAATFIYYLIKNIRGVFLIYDFFLGIIIASLTYTFYKIFVNRNSCYQKYKRKKSIYNRRSNCSSDYCFNCNFCF